jgi:hypothetical protein
MARGKLSYYFLSFPFALHLFQTNETLKLQSLQHDEPFQLLPLEAVENLPGDLGNGVKKKAR